MTDVELKNRGNKLFAARKYEEAITCYSDAIVSDAVDDLESCKIQMICEFSRMYSWCAVLYSGCIFMSFTWVGVYRFWSGNKKRSFGVYICDLNM